MSWNEIGKALLGNIQSAAATEIGDRTDAWLTQFKRSLKALAIAIVAAIFVLNGLVGGLTQLFVIPEYAANGGVGLVLVGLLYLYLKRPVA